MTDPIAEKIAQEHPTDTAYRAAEFIETYTGRKFYSLEPSAADVSVIDIAHALSNQCRYSGHTDSFYSTAQHCCILASYVENIMHGSALDCLQILIHDAAEAYLVDLARPIKQHMPEFRKWDKKIQYVVRDWLGLTDIAIPAWQDDLDTRIIVDERAQIMADSDNDWGMGGVSPLGVKVEPWSAKMAEQQFLFRFEAYYNGAFTQHAYLREAWGVTGPRLQATSSDDAKVSDLIEVDLLGKVGRVKLRSPDGMLIRDTAAGKFPRPAWKWMHGDFNLIVPSQAEIAKAYAEQS